MRLTFLNSTIAIDIFLPFLFSIKNGQGNTRPSLRFPALRYALLFAVVAGTVHSIGFAVTATGGSTLFLILYELQNNCGDNRREKKAYCNGTIMTFPPTTKPRFSRCFLTSGLPPIFLIVFSSPTLQKQSGIINQNLALYDLRHCIPVFRTSRPFSGTVR